MKKKEIVKPGEEFVSYEEARIEKPETEATDNITDEEIESANEILYPDENSMDSRG